LGAGHNGGTFWDFRIVVSGENDDGTFGGLIRFRDVGALQTGTATSAAGNAFGNSFGWVWWKPIDFVRFQIGQNAFGDFANWEIVRSGSFYGAGNDAGMGLAMLYSPFANSLAGNAVTGNLEDAFSVFYAAGATLSLYPMEGLSLNIGIPYARTSQARADDVYNNILYQAQYKIPDIGRLTVGFQAINAAERNGVIDRDVIYDLDLVGGDDPSGAFSELDNHAFYLGFLLTAVENLQVNFGLRFMLPYTQEEKDVEYDNGGGTLDKIELTRNYPVIIALGAAFDMDAFNIKARCQLQVGGSAEIKFSEGSNTDKMEYVDATTFYVELLPSYDLGPCRINRALGLNIASFEKDKNPNYDKDLESWVAFGVNPYVSKTIGGGNFFAGFKLWTDGHTVAKKDTGWKVTDTKAINWSVPVGMVVSF
jgi:hypothetical protein